MSKQSRAKSRARRKSQGTGSAAPMYINNFNRMCDANQYFATEELLDQLHKVLCDRRVFKDNKFMGLFRDNFWASLERELVMCNSKSRKCAVALELVVKIRAIRKSK